MVKRQLNFIPGSLTQRTRFKFVFSREPVCCMQEMAGASGGDPLAAYFEDELNRILFSEAGTRYRFPSQSALFQT